MDGSDATTKFQHASAYTIFNVAPGLAARYICRARLRSSESCFPDSCLKCGNYLLDGNSTIRVVRVRKRRHKAQKVLRRTCSVCGHRENIQLPKDVEMEPKSIERNHTQGVGQITSEQRKSTEVETRNASSSSIHEPLPRPINVHKKAPGAQRNRKMAKPGLQEMLSRKKEGKVQHLDQVDGGLASFLKAL